jgi:hypothetical protein
MVPARSTAMSIHAAGPEENAFTGGILVQAPRSGDMISGALRLAFGRQDKMIDDFAALLRQIDSADQAAKNC